MSRFSLKELLHSGTWTEVSSGGQRNLLWKSCYTSLLIFAFLPQIENASEVLITPLEKFRKEQIGAARVRILQTLFLPFRMESEDGSTSSSSSPAPLPFTRG